MQEHYRPDIDVLRGIAVCAVLGYHAFPSYFPGGFIGVDIFFVISGFLITGIIRRQLNQGTFSLAEFYFRRIRRIFPSLILVISVIWVLAISLLLPDELVLFGKHMTAGMLFLSNFILWQESGYFDLAAETKPLLHLWSLAIEEQFYLVWPAVLIASFRKHFLSSAMAGLLFISFALNIILIAKFPHLNFYLLPSRFWEFLLGGALAIILHEIAGRSEKLVLSICHSLDRNDSYLRISVETLALAALAGIVASVFLLNPKIAYPGWPSILPTMSSAAWIAIGNRSAIIRALTLRPSIIIGLISYPLYLWHWPLLSLTTILYAGHASAFERAAVLGISFLLAHTTWFLIELPIRKNQKYSKQIFIAILGATTVVVAVGILTWLSIISPITTISKSQHKLLKGFSSQFGLGYLEKFKTMTTPPCPESKLDSPDFYISNCLGRTHDWEIVIWGDSHAEHLLPGLQNSLPKDSQLLPLFSGCVPTAGNFDSQPPSCKLFNNRALEIISAAQPNLVILAARWNNVFYDESFQVEFSRTIRNLRSSGAQVLVIGNVPEWRPDLYKIIAKDYLRKGRPPAHRLKNGLDMKIFDIENHLLEISTSSGAKFFSPLSAMCNDDGCLVCENVNDVSTLMSWDYGHLTFTGSLFLGRHLEKLTIKNPGG